MCLGLRKKSRLSLKNDMPLRDKMDDPNITMEEYIRLEEEKARKCKKVFNWETAKYAIVYNDALTSKSDFSTELTLCQQHIDEFDLKDETSLSEYDEVEQNVLYFNDLFLFNIVCSDDLKSNKGNDENEIDMIQSLGSNENTNKLLEESHDKIRKNLYAPFGIPFNPKQYYKDGNCTRMLQRPRYKGLQYTDADIADLETTLARIYMKEILDKGDLRDYLIRISSAGDFLGTTPSYTSIRDPILRLCHRLIACSIDGRSQAPKKVTVTDLFYLRGLDVGSVNIPYLLARYLRRFAAERKSGALVLGGQFIARLAEHFGLLTEERLQGLTVIAPALLIIDITELIRLQIYAEFRDTWAWVPADAARQEGDVGRVAAEAPVAPEGSEEDEKMPQAVSPPPRTLGERIARLEEEVHGMREAVHGQREVLDSMARDFSRFTTWTVTSLARLMDRASVPYTRYTKSPDKYQRRTRQRTDGASTSIAP
uniref:Uncharacterized protein n=1 Tax=Tanacetum cinerariifolium TaxID=118510 RepID=A0A6L2K5C3_TANCI|nr:hypothetical protein [Tanacetum cinerariifolium]